MSKIKVAFSSDLVEPYFSHLKEMCDVKIVGKKALGRNPTEDELLEQCLGCDVVYINTEVVTEKCIEAWKASGMKLLGCGRGTPVNVDWKAVHKAGIPLVYTPGRNANSVSEYVFGLLIALVRRIAANNHALRSGRYLGPEKENVLDIDFQQDVVWYMPDGTSPMRDFGGGFELYGRTISIIGYGAIGRRVAHTAKEGFGMEVKVYDPYCTKEDIESGGYEKVELDEALSTADVISIHLPVNKETKGMVDESWFSKMKSTAIFINSARASVVDQKALIDAIEEGKIAGAAMDVMWQEPAPKNHPLLDRDNVLITSHLAGMSCDVARWQSEMIFDEIKRFVNGQEPKLVWKRTE